MKLRSSARQSGATKRCIYCNNHHADEKVQTCKCGQKGCSGFLAKHVCGEKGFKNPRRK